MATVHVFVCSKRFKSFEEMRDFIDPTYDEDGDSIKSEFMREVKLSSYEPMCIEAIHKEHAMKLSELLQGASYCDQWLSKVDCSQKADSAILVFEPNEVKNPEGCSLKYCGAFQYKP